MLKEEDALQEQVKTPCDTTHILLLPRAILELKLRKSYGLK